ncbi:glucuronyl esterase domain-containing protein [Maricaulaceae bacterium MS644]
MSASRLRFKIALAAGLVLFAAGCAGMVSPLRHILATAENTPARAALTPPLLAEGYGRGPAATLADWRARRDALLTIFADEIYGAAPPAPQVSATLDERLAPAGWVGPGRLELSTLTLSVAEDDPGAEPVTMRLAVLKPDGPVRGVFLIPSDCGLRPLLSDARIAPPDAFRPSWCGDPEGTGGPPGGVIGALFGAHIVTPPLDLILASGFAVAAWHESDIAPDSEDQLGASLLALGLDPDPVDRPGVLSLWAWTLSSVVTALEADPELAYAPLFAYGHSRRGKAVLLAGARDERIDLVLAHQSGTAGAAPHGDMTGEPVASMARNYPHWFTQAYQRYAEAGEAVIPVNQHQLIALIAPRALHLGGANRDTWADPLGAETAARAAHSAWRLYGVDPETKLSSHLRGGTHGVREADWAAFLAAAERVADQAPE